MRYTVHNGVRPKDAQKLNQVAINDYEGIHFRQVQLLLAERGEGMGAQRSDKLAGLIQSLNTVLRA